MRIRSDGVCFVQDDNFKGRIGVTVFVVVVVIIILVIIAGIHFVVVGLKKTFLGRCCSLSHGKAGKMLDFVSHDRNSAFVTRIEFQDATLPLGWVPQLTTKGKCYRGLSKERKKKKTRKKKHVRVEGVREVS